MQPLFDKILNFYRCCGMVKIKNWKGENVGPQAFTPVQTNYPDSLSPSALQQTLITREPGGAIIKAEPNERWGWSYSDTIHPSASPADIKEETSSECDAAGRATPIRKQGREHVGRGLWFLMWHWRCCPTGAPDDGWAGTLVHDTLC